MKADEFDIYSRTFLEEKGYSEARDNPGMWWKRTYRKDASIRDVFFVDLRGGPVRANSKSGKSNAELASIRRVLNSKKFPGQRSIIDFEKGRLVEGRTI